MPLRRLVLAHQPALHVPAAHLCVPPPATLPPRPAQDILEEGEVKTDASGNPILKDVGPWMKSEIKKAFKDADVKYIDPS